MESRLGLSKANIRFYEKEGLLSPCRSANGYRDYTEEDAARLRQISVLRKLGMPLSDIRAVLSGEQDMAQALERTHDALEQQLESLGGALRLCETMQEDLAHDRMKSADCYWEQLAQAEAQGARFADLLSDYAEVEKNVFLGMWRGVFLVDMENHVKTYGWTIAVLTALGLCLAKGLSRKFFWKKSFWYGFYYPMLLFVAVTLLVLPVFLLQRKYHKTLPPRTEAEPLRRRLLYSLHFLIVYAGLIAFVIWSKETLIFPALTGSGVYIANIYSTFFTLLPFYSILYGWIIHRWIHSSAPLFGIKGFALSFSSKEKKRLFAGAVSLYLCASALSLLCFDGFTETGCLHRTPLSEKNYTWEDVDYCRLDAMPPDRDVLSFTLVMKDGTQLDCTGSGVSYSPLPEDRYPNGSTDYILYLARTLHGQGVALIAEDWNALESELMEYWANLVRELHAIADSGGESLPVYSVM